MRSVLALLAKDIPCILITFYYPWLITVKEDFPDFVDLKERMKEKPRYLTITFGLMG